LVSIEQYIGCITHAILHHALFAFLVQSHARSWSRHAQEPIAPFHCKAWCKKRRAMSKSKQRRRRHGNGANTGQYRRLYTLFAATPEKDLEWSEESIEGAWALHQPRLPPGRSLAESLRESKRYSSLNLRFGKSCSARLIRHLRRVTLDGETRWHFNSAIGLDHGFLQRNSRPF